jgi:hypothetical protein
VASAPGSQRCLDCPAGYENSGLRGCVDIYECGWSDGCDSTSTCVNNVGGYSCQCGPGFHSVNGNHCSNTDACATANGGCAQRCTDPGTGAVCSCEAGFDLAGDGHSCTPWAQTALYNDGLRRFLNATPGGAVNTTAGAQLVTIAPAGVDTFTITAAGRVYCASTVAPIGALYTLNPAQASGNSACTWSIFGVSGAHVRLVNAWIQANHPELDWLFCPTASGCSFQFQPTATAKGNSVFTVVNCTTSCIAPPTDDDLDGRPDNNFDGTTDACFGNAGNADGDRWCDDVDVCPQFAALDQKDTDQDGIGDDCDNCEGTVSVRTGDQNNDGVGDQCDPTFIPLSLGSDPLATYNGGNPARPACGFVPKCPSDPGATKLNSYWSGTSAMGGFGCYSDEPAGGDLCLGDRWWHHVYKRIHPMMPGTQTSGTDSVLDAIDDEEAATPPSVFQISCTSPANCPGGIGCYDGVCIPPHIKDYVDRMTVSSQFLSCTGAQSWERTWPADSTFRLTRDTWCVAGYSVENTTSMPMAFWVGRKGGDASWWTLNPGETVRFNATDGAYFFATTAEAYRVCDPAHMTRKLYPESLNLPSIHTLPITMVSYVASDGGRLTLYRDRDLWMMYQLYEYPNYFGVGLDSGPTAKGGWFASNPLQMRGVVAPVTFLDIDCTGVP